MVKLILLVFYNQIIISKAHLLTVSILDFNTCMLEIGYNLQANTESVYTECAYLVSVRFFQKKYEHKAYEENMK